MKRSYCLMVFTILMLGASVPTFGQTDIRKELFAIQDVPYLPELSGDSLYWDLVIQGKTILPQLIDCIDIEQKSDIAIPNWGGEYTYGDIAFDIINHIIHNIPYEQLFSKQGVDTYFSFIDSSPRSRNQLQDFIRSWYEKNRLNLVWISDDRSYKTSRDWKYPSNRHPAGGWYETK